MCDRNWFVAVSIGLVIPDIFVARHIAPIPGKRISTVHFKDDKIRFVLSSSMVEQENARDRMRSPQFFFSAACFRQRKTPEAAEANCSNTRPRTWEEKNNNNNIVQSSTLYNNN